MHVTTKEVDDQGVHILTSVIEADGPIALCSADAKISAKVISVQRTSSGGIQVQAAVEIQEPAPKPAPTRDDEAIAFLASKGIKGDEARQMIAKFGRERILAQKKEQEAQSQKQLDQELQKALS